MTNVYYNNEQAIEGIKPSTIVMGRPGNLPRLKVNIYDKKEPIKIMSKEETPVRTPKFAEVFDTTIEYMVKSPIPTPQFLFEKVIPAINFSYVVSPRIFSTLFFLIKMRSAIERTREIPITGMVGIKTPTKDPRAPLQTTKSRFFILSDSASTRTRYAK